MYSAKQFPDHRLQIRIRNRPEPMCPQPPLPVEQQQAGRPAEPPIAQGARQALAWLGPVNANRVRDSLLAQKCRQRLIGRPLVLFEHGVQSDDDKVGPAQRTVHPFSLGYRVLYATRTEHLKGMNQYDATPQVGELEVMVAVKPAPDLPFRKRPVRAHHAGASGQ